MCSNSCSCQLLLRGRYVALDLTDSAVWREIFLRISSALEERGGCDHCQTCSHDQARPMHGDAGAGDCKDQGLENNEHRHEGNNACCRRPNAGIQLVRDLFRDFRLREPKLVLKEVCNVSNDFREHVREGCVLETLISHGLPSLGPDHRGETAGSMAPISTDCSSRFVAQGTQRVQPTRKQ